MCGVDLAGGGDGADLAFEAEAGMIEDLLADEADQVQHVVRRGVAGVDDEVGVLATDLGAADAVALEPQVLDDASRLASLACTRGYSYQHPYGVNCKNPLTKRTFHV